LQPPSGCFGWLLREAQKPPKPTWLSQGTVAGTARGINVSNARADEQGLATVNPIFTWVRLAQRVPVRIRIDHVPDGVRLVAGTTATVQVDSDRNRR
jgi:multidrug resistance efflux pump